MAFKRSKQEGDLDLNEDAVNTPEETAEYHKSQTELHAENEELIKDAIALSQGDDVSRNQRAYLLKILERIGKDGQYEDIVILRGVVTNAKSSIGKLNEDGKKVEDVGSGVSDIVENAHIVLE